jgi:aminopeptidase N
MLHTKLIINLLLAAGIFVSTVATINNQAAIIAARPFDKSRQQPAPQSTSLPTDDSFDVKHYDIHLRMDVAAKAISGTVTIKALAVAAGLKAIRLDLADYLTVDSVTSGDKNLAFTHGDEQLNITLAQAYRAGSPFEVTINYKGQPTGGARSGFFFSSRRSVPVIGSNGLPYNAPYWLPCKDGPGDKADSADIAITLPQELVVVSNGKLVEETNNGDGTKTSRWAVRYPIYPDVIAVEATNYATFTLPYKSSTGALMEMKFYVYPEDLEKAKIDFSVLPDMMKHYAALFGEYPFLKEKYGVAEYEGGWKEHQTIPGYTYLRITGDHANDFILGHELAHQWFGNSLSLKNRSHVWLNEGFSDYAYWLWLERSRGRAAYMAEMRKASQKDFNGPVYIKEPKKAERNKLIDLNLFSRSALVLHMLRHVMGDAPFFRALRKYVKTYSYRNVVTEDFQKTCEQEFGRSLDWFFKQWVYGEGRPEYEYRWSVSQAAGKRMLKLVIDQTQTNTGLFEMPLDVVITTPAGSRTVTVRSKLKSESFEFPVNVDVTQVLIDPDEWVLKKIKPAQ